MTARKFRVATFHFEHYMELHKNQHGKMVPENGVDANLLKVLADKMNFKYDLVLTDTPQWGMKTEDGNWTGIIGMASRNETDIAMSSLDISDERSEVVDFSYTYLSDDVTFVTGRPDLKCKAFAFTWPFTPEVWLLVLLSLLVYSFLMHVHNIFPKKAKAKRARQPELMKIVWSFYGFLLGQGMNLKEVVPRCPSGKLLFSIWLLFRTFIVFCYGCIILPVLLFVSRNPPVDTIDGLSKAVTEGKYSAVATKGTSYYSTLLAAKEGIVAELGTSLALHPEIAKRFEHNSGMHLDTLSDGKLKLAFIHSENMLKFMVIRNKKQGLILAKDSLLLHFAGIAVRKQFCCLEEINEIIHRITAAGLVNKWLEDEMIRERIKDSKRSSQDQESNLTRPLAMTDFYGTFLVLLVGFSLAFFILILETCIFKLNNFFGKH